MAQMTLKPRSLLELIDLFERSNHAIADVEGQRLRGVPGWDLARRGGLTDRELSAWTQRIGFAGSYSVASGDERVAVAIEEDDDPGRYRYRCPETFRTKFVAAAQVGIHAVDEAKLLNYLADLLAIPQADRRGITTSAIDGVLWNLGKMRVGNVLVDVWIVRGLTTCINQVFAHFQTPSLPEQGVIFTTGQALPEIVPPPRSYRIIPITDVLMDKTAKPSIDIDLIHRLLLAPSGTKEDKSHPVRFDPYTNTLIIATKADKPWTIKGTKQIAAVMYLVEQFKNGRTRVSAGDILVAAHGSSKAAKGKRVASIFSGNLVWEDYIEHDENGYGIKLD